MKMKEQAGKGAILTAGVGCVSSGITLIKEGQIEYGIALIIIGFALVFAYVYLMEKETIEKSVKKVLEMKKWTRKKSRK